MRCSHASVKLKLPHDNIGDAVLQQQVRAQQSLLCLPAHEKPRAQASR